MASTLKNDIDAGTTLPVQAKRINSTDTTATNMVALPTSPIRPAPVLPPPPVQEVENTKPTRTLHNTETSQ